MQDIVIFVSEQWMLFSLLVLILVLMVLNSKPKNNEISPHDAVKLINENKVIIYDVRPDEEFKRAHIINAINIKFENIDFNKNKENLTIIYGNDSIQLTKKIDKVLKTKNDDIKSKVYVLKYGLSEWLSEDFPVVTGKK